MSDIDFKKMKVAELKAELSARSIDIPRGAKKAELLAMLMSSVEAEGGAGDAEQEKGDAPVHEQPSLPVDEENESQNESATEESTSVSNEVVQPNHENDSEEKIPPAADETSSNTDEVASTIAEAGSTVAEASSPSPDESFVDEKLEDESAEEPAVADETNDCHDETEENNEMADDIVELEEPGMQDLVDESDNKAEESKDESMDKADNNEGDAATDMQQEQKQDNDAADEAMSIDASGLDTSLSKDESEEKQTSAAPKTNEENRSSKCSEGSSRHSDRRGGDHHSDRKRRHEDSRSQRRDDERFAPPPEEPEEEFDDTLVVMDKYNSSLNMKLHQNRVTLQTLTLESFAFLWASSRATYGVKAGKVHFECKINEEHSVRHMPHNVQHRHPVRIGWSDNKTSLLIGESEMSFALCSTGKAVTNKTSKDFGSGYKEGDVVGCYLDLSNDETVTVIYTKNGESLGTAFTEEKSKFEGKTMFPHISCRNVTVEFNFGQKDEPYFPHPEELNDYQFIASIPVEERVRGLAGPTAKKDCDVLMLCGLPGCGKSYYATKLCEENPEKFYNVLGAKSIMSNMTVTGLPGMKRDVKLNHANNCLTRIFQIACRKKRHYIIDQTNVFSSARRKMRSFEGFNRKAIVIVPTDEDYKSRADKRTRDEGKDIPDYAVIDMKANFSFPEKGDLFEEVEFLELNQADAEKQVSKYREEARKRGPPQEKRFRSNGGSGPFGFSGQRSMGSRWGGSMGGGSNFDFPKGGSGMGRMSGFRGGQQRGGFGNGGNINRYMGSNGGGRSNSSRGGGGYGDGRRNSGSFSRAGNNFQQGSGGNRSFSGGSSAGGRAGYGGNRNGPGAGHRSNNRQGSGGYNQSRQNSSSMSGGARNHSRSRSSSQTAPHRSSFGQNNQQQAGVTNRTSFDYHRAYQQQTAQIAAAAAAAQQQQQQQQQAAVAAAAVAAVPQPSAAPQAAAAAQTQPQATYSQAYTAQGQNDYSQQWAQYYQHQAAVQQQHQQQQAAAAAAAAQYQSYYAYQQAFSGQK